MEDSAVEYVLVAQHTPLESWNVTRTPIENDHEDFVVITADDLDDNYSSSPSWWTSLQNYAKSAAAKGGEWTKRIKMCNIPFANMLRIRHSTIHDCYDWVSDTDIEGGRLILPGQLIVWDDSNGSQNDDDTRNAQTSNTRLVGDVSSSTIMVSAHDLLVYQKQHQSSRRDETGIVSSNTTLSIPAALIKIVNHHAHIKTKATTEMLLISCSTVKQRLVTLLQKCENRIGLVSNTAGWIYLSLEWYFPSTIEQEHSRVDNVTIELSTVNESFETTCRQLPNANSDE